MPEDEQEKPIEGWKVLEALTVSLDRLGHFWINHGEEAAKDALHQFMSPAMVRKIAHVRRLILDVLEERDPTIMERLEAMDDSQISYWNGPTA